VVFQLFTRWYGAPRAGWRGAQDWRSWNYSQRRAANLIKNYEARLKVLAADCIVDGRLMNAQGVLQEELVLDGLPVSAERLTGWINTDP
jgi:hypothetical protein